MSSPMSRFNHLPRRLREKLGSDFLASLLVTFSAGVVFFSIVAVLIVALP